jgi:hypothetical protein
MNWNRGASILGKQKDPPGDEGATTTEAVYSEASTIFTAAFIGMVIDRGREGYEVHMEPDMDLYKDKSGQPLPARQGQQQRTQKDRQAMQKLNDVCAKVNHIVRSFRPLLEDDRGIHWGLTPEYTRGGLIAGGGAALKAYGGYDPKLLETAWDYLSQDRERDIPTVYIGRGAYCGLAVDENGDAPAAMSTLCTTLSAPPAGGDPATEYPLDAGPRWLPAPESAVFTERAGQAGQRDAQYIWGMIGKSVDQGRYLKEGMKFVPRPRLDDKPDKKPFTPKPGSHLVGYTHGMVRAIYECERMGNGYPFEMSLGIHTAKLASCMSCSLFMVANGYAPSASHLGAGESWLPLYHGRQHVFSPLARTSVAASETRQAVLGAIRKALEAGETNPDRVLASAGADLNGKKEAEKLLAKVKAALQSRLASAAAGVPTPSTRTEAPPSKVSMSQDEIMSVAEEATHKANQKADLLLAVRECNDRWAWKMTAWITTGVQAMLAQSDNGWITDVSALRRLASWLNGVSIEDNPMACANLYLDAMTCHAKDVDRLNTALQYGKFPVRGSEYGYVDDLAGTGRPSLHALTDWLALEWRSHPWLKLGWRQFSNPFSDDAIMEFRAPPRNLKKL